MYGNEERWLDFYRRNPVRFIETSLKVRLSLFQKILLQCILKKSKKVEN